uniref:Uncharacterized protein n=1 Tax=Anopheles funestus TaxID=62324 RepID=A0A4Y0BJD6_ANOFN
MAKAYHTDQRLVLGQYQRTARVSVAGRFLLITASTKCRLTDHQRAESFLTLGVRDNLQRCVLKLLCYLATVLHQTPTANYDTVSGIITVSGRQSDRLHTLTELYLLRKLHQRHIIRHEQWVVFFVLEELGRHQHLASVVRLVVEINCTEMYLHGFGQLYAMACRKDPLFVQ